VPAFESKARMSKRLKTAAELVALLTVGIVAVSIGVDMPPPVAVPYLLNQTSVQLSVLEGGGHGP
jgi:uncharacterized membrane protein YciS (DUF1049 family)